MPIETIDDLLYQLTLQLKPISITTTKEGYTFHLKDNEMIFLSKDEIQKKYLLLVDKKTTTLH